MTEQGEDRKMIDEHTLTRSTPDARHATKFYPADQ